MEKNKLKKKQRKSIKKGNEKKEKKIFPFVLSSEHKKIKYKRKRKKDLKNIEIYKYNR